MTLSCSSGSGHVPHRELVLLGMLGLKTPLHDDTLNAEPSRHSAHLGTQTGVFGTASDIFGVNQTDPCATVAIPVQRFSVPRLALLLTFGIVLGVALFLAVTPSATSPRKRTVGQHSSTTPVKLAVTAASEQVAAPVVEQLPSLEQHVKTSPVTLAARRFLFADGSGRAYGPDFSRGKFEHRHTDGQLTRNDLTAARSGGGRYTADSSVEWQGGFRHAAPQQNLELGQTYLRYLESSVGAELGKKLSVVSGERVNILDKVTKTGRGPNGLRP